MLKLLLGRAARYSAKQLLPSVAAQLVMKSPCGETCPRGLYQPVGQQVVGEGFSQENIPE